MRTFCIQTLGCRVNQYESEQIAALLTKRGLVPAPPGAADLRIVNTCSVTSEADAKSRQSIRRSTRLSVLQPNLSNFDASAAVTRGRTVVTGCFATSDTETARSIPGVDAVITHHQDVAKELANLLNQWVEPATNVAPEPGWYDGSMIEAGAPAVSTVDHKPPGADRVKKIPARQRVGTVSLPLLGDHQTGRQRAFLKVQDGCDAHCSYCIIPHLRPAPSSKPIHQAVQEAQRLVDAGHVEIVLTGIFLGAYGQPTAIRRNQPAAPAARPLAHLVDALCTRVRGLRRLRFSSLEPGDLTRDLLVTMKSHPQVVPHFHLPLQSGSDTILRRMKRQYTRGDYLRMIDDVRSAFDRPAITTDIIVGFPGETDDEFTQTLDAVDRARFIHIHAFPFSPRPGTPAAGWTRECLPPRVAENRIHTLKFAGDESSLSFRRSFVGQTVEVLIENSSRADGLRHGRCERYFDVCFEASAVAAGQAAIVRIDQVTADRTCGRIVGCDTAIPGGGITR